MRWTVGHYLPIKHSLCIWKGWIGTERGNH